MPLTDIAAETDKMGDDVTIAGRLDAVTDGRVRGWAFDPQTPDQAVSIRILVDQRPIAELVADQYRSDLEKDGYGNGRHGFSASLPAALLDGRQSIVEAVDVRTGARLNALALTYRLLRRDPAQAALGQLFDLKHYESQAGLVAFPLEHYRKTGWRQGFDPHPLFATRHYLAQHGPLDTDPLTHFAEIGQFSNAWPHPIIDMRVAAASKGVRFDRNASQAATDEPPVHPLLAYLASAKAGATAPARHFSDADYKGRYHDVDDARYPPLLHYLRYGGREGRRPHPDFDPKLFAKLANLDRRIEPYTHFLTWLYDRGGTEERENRRAEPTRWPEAPAVSIILLNYNKSLLTLQSLYFIQAHTPENDVEIIIVDNGSRHDEFERLARHVRGAVVVRLTANRGFGEGNNIGVEHARGRLLMFLNNDAFVRPGWLAPLRAAIDGDPSVGAACAKMLYPDGRLQEAGAFVSSCGTAVQRGKHLNPDLPIFNRPGPVDYGSAAALMVRADAFRAVLGFDLAWDPAYYEDTDLCLKLKVAGLTTVYVPTSEVVHLEHATSADAGLNLKLQNIVATNRLKFIERWGTWLAGLQPPPSFAPVPARARRGDSTRTLGLFTPYALTPGGGERYLLSIAASLREDYRCIVFTPDRYSHFRLLALGRDLNLKLDHVELRVLSEAASIGHLDVFVCMANEVLPPMRGFGRVNIYHCQFPFPMAPEHYGRGWDILATYQSVVVNSAFTARHYAKAIAEIGITSPPIEIVFPPVPQIAQSGSCSAAGVRRILSVGRFASGGHCKCQHLMIAELRKLLSLSNEKIELHLAGSVGAESEAREYLQSLVESSRELPVHFHLNASAGKIADLYRESDIYWHLTGAEYSVDLMPEVFEHFGIALVEAMSVGAVPIALGLGGPSEIITDGENGIVIKAYSELAAASLKLLNDRTSIIRIGEAAKLRASDFSFEHFDNKIKSRITQLK